MAGVAARGCDHTRETTLEFRPGVERNVASFFQSLSAIGEIVCVMDRTRKMLIVLIRVDFFFLSPWDFFLSFFVNFFFSTCTWNTLKLTEACSHIPVCFYVVCTQADELLFGKRSVSFKDTLTRP